MGENLKQALREARGRHDAAVQAMEHHANRCIEHLLRRGVVTRADVKKLRAFEGEAREATIAVKAAKAAFDASPESKAAA